MVEQVASSVELKRHAGQRRSQAIVQVTTQAAAFLFASGDELGTRLLEFACQALQIRGEPHRMGGYPSLPCQVREQRTISRREGLTRPTGSKHQFTDQVALVAER